MKLLYIITGLNTGGAETMLYHILSKLDRDRIQPAVLSLMDRGTLGDRIASLDIPIYTLGIQPGKLPNPSVIWQCRQILRQFQPDVLQGWMYHGNLVAQFASGFVGKPIPVFWNIQCSQYSLKLEKKLTAAIVKFSAPLSRFARRVIYVSHIGQTQHEALGYDAQKSCVIPNAIDPELFTPSPQAKPEICRELGIPESSILIGLFCRYHPMKDHNNFLQAAALLTAQLTTPSPEIHFILAGTGVTPDNTELQQLIATWGVGDRVHLLGERRDMPYLTAALDIDTSASAYGEAWSLSIGEALSCGVPCAVTDVGDSAWMVGDTGRVVPPKNPEALAQAWQSLIELGESGRQALGQTARSRILHYFSLDAVVAQYERLYADAVTQIADNRLCADAMKQSL
jgi:glycosyltransferase involved in cell wall biosynthesis